MVSRGGGGSLCKRLRSSNPAPLTRTSVEGAATLGIAIIGYFLVIGFPDQILASGKYAGFTQRELEIVLNRVERDRGDAKADKLTRAKVLRHSADWKLWYVFYG